MLDDMRDYVGMDGFESGWIHDLIGETKRSRQWPVSVMKYIPDNDLLLTQVLESEENRKMSMNDAPNQTPTLRGPRGRKRAGQGLSIHLAESSNEDV